MGYAFTIGTAEPTYPDAGDNGFGWTVKHRFHPNAPAIPGDAQWSLRGNQRSASYTEWEEFTDAVGLSDLFISTDTPLALFRHEREIAPLTMTHVLRVEAALTKYRAAQPGTVPSFKTAKDDAYLGNLVWLAWWVRHAVDYCRHPAIEAR